MYIYCSLPLHVSAAHGPSSGKTYCLRRSLHRTHCSFSVSFTFVYFSTVCSCTVGIRTIKMVPECNRMLKYSIITQSL
jgi:hypothetical protein